MPIIHRTHEVIDLRVFTNIFSRCSISFCVEQMLELHQGQGMDIYWRDAHICPSEEDYKEMVLRSKSCVMYMQQCVVLIT